MRLAPVLLAVLACTPPAPMRAPAPVALTVPYSPAVVVQRAAQQLSLDGFTIVTSDGVGGVLTASLRRQGRGSWGPFITSRYPEGSLGNVRGGAVLTVRVTAVATPSGSAVRIASGTTATPGSLGDDTDAASSGEAERRIVAALTAP